MSYSHHRKRNSIFGTLKLHFSDLPTPTEEPAYVTTSLAHAPEVSTTSDRPSGILPKVRANIHASSSRSEEQANGLTSPAYAVRSERERRKGFFAKLRAKVRERPVNRTVEIGPVDSSIRKGFALR